MRERGKCPSFYNQETLCRFFDIEAFNIPLTFVLFGLGTIWHFIITKQSRSSVL